MSNYDVIRIICLTIGIICINISIIIFGLKIVSIFKDKHNLDAEKFINEKKNTSMSPSRTKEFHEFLKFITTETAVIKFNKYRMNNDITKINRSTTQRIITDIASETYKSLADKIELLDNDSLLTREYYMTYITNIAIITVDKLINDIIGGIIE
jgi:hypothetical protein